MNPSKFYLGLILAITLLMVNAAHAQGNPAYDLIEQVNALRAARGLPPYQMDGSLMYAAQLHSEYQASTGSITHNGPWGSRPRDRAAAAGYGGGATIFVSENIAGGTGMTVQDVVTMWKGDSVHLDTMLSTNYTHIGAGVASEGNRTYYTIDVGYIAGQGNNSPASSNTSSNNPGTSTSSNLPPASALVNPVVVSSINEDGSIVHIVAPGQALEMIANAYQVQLSDILVLNNLVVESIIRPGDEIIIKPADVEVIEAEKDASDENIILISPTGTPIEIIKNDLIIIKTTPVVNEMVSLVESSPDQEENMTQRESPRNINPKHIMMGFGVIMFLGTGLIILITTLGRKI